MNPATVMIFTSAQQAHAVRSVLEANGVEAIVIGDQMTDTLSIYGNAVARIELLVEERYLDEAQSIVHDVLALSPNNQWTTQEDLWWRCDQCREISGPAFDECWSCGQSRSENAERVAPGRPSFPSDRTELVAKVVDSDAENPSPYRAPQHQTAAIAMDRDSQELPLRALKASVFGAILPIPMAPYGAYLVYRCLATGQWNRQVWVAMAFSIGAVLLAIMIALAAIAQL